MSLLIFSSANKIGQGILKRLYAAGNFEKITYADIYPTYSSIERSLQFKEELEGIQSKTTLKDMKISDRSDLHKAITNASHVVYITHDYYSLTPSKLNLIKTTAELSKQSKIEKLIALTPIEHDHYNEINPLEAVRNSEQEAKNHFPDLLHLKCDITFGPHSTFAHNILNKIANEESIHFMPKYTTETAAPIYSDDVAKVVEACLNDSKLKQRSFFLEGPQSKTLGDLIVLLQNYLGRSAKINENPIEKIIPPTSSHILSEKLYNPEYINLASFIKQYRSQSLTNFEKIDSFGLTLTDIDEFYPNNSANQKDYKVENDLFKKDNYKTTRLMKFVSASRVISKINSTLPHTIL